jgi:predicted ATPase
MKRIAIVVDISKHQTTFIMVDYQNAGSILPYIMRDSVDKEFKDIRAILKENLRNKEKYCKTDVSDKAKNMFEMRFTNNGRNDRIYCQEVSFGGKRIIIMVELFEGKKSQDIPKRIKSRIETMGGYEYEIQI